MFGVIYTEIYLKIYQSHILIFYTRTLVRNGYILKLHFQIKTQKNCPLLESIYNVKFMSLCFIDKNINHKLLIPNCF